MNPPNGFPQAIAIQNIHDEIQTAKPSTDKTKTNNNSNENIELFKIVRPPFLTKIKIKAPFLI